MGSGYYTQLRAILLAHGCEFVRQGRGSHEMWFSPINRASFPVPVSISNRHTVNGILKQAGISARL